MNGRNCCATQAAGPRRRLGGWNNLAGAAGRAHRGARVGANVPHHRADAMNSPAIKGAFLDLDLHRAATR